MTNTPGNKVASGSLLVLSVLLWLAAMYLMFRE